MIILRPPSLEPRIFPSVAIRRTHCIFAPATYLNTDILFATVKTVTKTTAVQYIFSFYTPCRHKGEWSYCSTHSQYLHQMAVNGQFHTPASVPRGKATLCHQSRRLDGPQWRSGCLCKNQICCSYQKRVPEFYARRINTVSLFIIIFYWF